MRVGIVGSRRRLDRASVARLVQSLARTDIVVSGGCRGVDTWAVEEADKRMMSHAEHLPAIRPGMSRDAVVKAYYARNRKIAEDSDIVYAFVAPDRTGGTENTIKHCRELGIRVVILTELSTDAALKSYDAPNTLKEAAPQVYNKRGSYPKDAVYVGRPSAYGNQFQIGPDGTREDVIALNRTRILADPEYMRRIRQHLRGKNLLCFCAPLPCHADFLLQVANEIEE